MYIDKDFFENWMQRLLGRIAEMDNKMQAFINTKDVFEDEDKLLRSEDLCLMLQVSMRTLQRYRSEGVLPYIKKKQKIYYKTSDVHAFVFAKGDQESRE
jgi:hypothetical protein